ncbi:hypothetical protein SAMN02910382_03136, partial [Butyrivibrio sp. TB]
VEEAVAPPVEEAAMPEMPVMEEAPAVDAVPPVEEMVAPSVEEAVAPPVEEAAMPEMPVMEEAPAVDAAPPAEEEAPPVEDLSLTDDSGASEDTENTDISGFLNENDYEYVAVTTGNVTKYIVKKVGGAMCVQYEDGEFVAFNRNYEHEDYSTYGGILFSFIKEAIQGTGCENLIRHKGTNIN